jgi:proteasome accessory factor B
VITEAGRWYLVGHDRDRDATRTFRLSRIADGVTVVEPAGAVTPPAGIDLRSIVREAVREARQGAEGGAQARVWVADGRATALRRAGSSAGVRELAGRAGEVIEIEIGVQDRLAREIAGYGADAIVLEPESLRDDVLERLRARAGDTR